MAFVVPSVVAQTDASAPSTAVCLIGDHLGIPEADAHTVAMLVCDELRKQGISIGEPVYEAPTSANVYRVVLRRLGEKVFVRLSQENPVGSILIVRQILLANIEEMVSAAPRLVDALVGRKSIASTVGMENVTEQEARVIRKIAGESLWHMGILGAFIPGTDIAAEPGYEFGWSYETPAYAVGTEFRGRGHDEYGDDGNRFSFHSWSIGGRYFFNKQNMSPYVGGGISIVGASYETKGTQRKKDKISDEWELYDDHDPEEKSGLGAYGVVGIEILRLAQSRLKLELRVDRPFFKLPSRDIMPITVGISLYIPGNFCLF